MLSFATLFVSGWIVAIGAGLVLAWWFKRAAPRTSANGAPAVTAASKTRATPDELRAALVAAAAVAIEEKRDVLTAPLFLLVAIGAPRVAAALRDRGIAIGALRERLRGELPPPGEVEVLGRIEEWKFDDELRAAMSANQPYQVHRGDPLYAWARTLFAARGIQLPADFPRLCDGVFVRIANDDRTTMAFVTQALEEELAVPHEAAIFIMYAVHYGALGQVQVLSREDAETAKARIESRARAKGFPLRVDVFVTADEPGGWEHSVPA